MDLLVPSSPLLKSSPTNFPSRSPSNTYRRNKRLQVTTQPRLCVSEAAAAIRLLEEASAQAISRAHDLAYSIQTKLQLSEGRAEHAEAMAES